MLLWFDATQSLLVYYMKSLTTSSSKEDGNATGQDLLIIHSIATMNHAPIKPDKQ